MSLLLVQLLVMLCLAESRQEKDLHENRRRKARVLSYQEQVMLGKDTQGLGVLGVESAFKGLLEQEGPVLAVAQELVGRPHLASSQRSAEKRPPRLSLPAIELQQLDENPAVWAIPDPGHFPPDALRGFFPLQLTDARNTEPANRRHAKKFWNQFLLRKNSASEDLVLPARAEEQGQESCRTLPFTQSIVNENCEKVVMENNLCFGKCSSFHVPGPADHLYTFCSHCLPSKFTMHHLEMNCTGATTQVKVIMVVEECHCEVQRSKHPQPTLFKANLDSDVPNK